MNQILLQQEIRALLAEMRLRTPDNPTLAGRKVYSQMDEDGIITEIFRRIGEGGRVFVEVGCGNGTENNTHAALLAGWRGVWIDGSRDNVESIARWIPLDSGQLHVRCEFVTRDNAAELIRAALARYGTRELDLLSIDIDGNDLIVLQRILPETQPRVIVCEYNGRFPPPLSVAIAYNASHVWAGDDYFGASLQALVEGLGGYRLVACNLAGSNAFFVREDLSGPFAKYSAEELYQPARHHMLQLSSDETASLKALRDLLVRQARQVKER